ncbi:hypothetical protein [Cupriavidus sp. DL-D2]|uniref:hypothetical protein n=1 Tax=Cupriavidus sp. DL-D2 TaxID=3144974 RepID=UPI00321579C7
MSRYLLSAALVLLALTPALTLLTPRYGEQWDPMKDLLQLSLVVCSALTVATLSIYWRLMRRVRSFLVGTAMLSLVIALTTGMLYFTEALKFLAQAEMARSVQADSRHPHMLIATTPVESRYSDDDRTGTIAQWERCALGSVTCSESPRMAYMKCRSGTFSVPERQWPRFAPVPGENAAGSLPLRSTRFCAED